MTTVSRPELRRDPSQKSNDKASFTPYTNCPGCGADLRSPGSTLAGIVGRCRTCHAQKLTAMNQRRTGAAHPSAKLSPEQVKAIRNQVGKRPQKEMAEEFGVSENLISRVVTGRGY